MRFPTNLNFLLRLYKTNHSFQEFVKFCIVGVICTILDVVIYNLVRLFAPYPIALISGYCISLILNYYLTIHWTFRKKANTKNAFGVIGAHLFNLFVVRMGLMYLWVDFLEVDDQKAYVITLLISVVTNFIIVKYVVTRFQNH